MYSYKELSQLKNLTDKEKKALGEYDKENEKFEGEASASDKKKEKIRKETMDNLKKFGEASKKYQEKGKKTKVYLDQKSWLLY